MTDTSAEGVARIVDDVAVASVVDTRLMMLRLNLRPTLVDTRYVTTPIEVASVIVDAQRYGTDAAWELRTVEVRGQHVSEDGTYPGMSANRTYHGGTGYVYALADMPGWLWEVLITHAAIPRPVGLPCSPGCGDDDHFLTIRFPDGTTGWSVHVDAADIARLAGMSGTDELAHYREVARRSIEAQQAGAYLFTVSPPRAASVSAATIVQPATAPGGQRTVPSVMVDAWWAGVQGSGQDTVEISGAAVKAGIAAVLRAVTNDG